MAMITMRTQIAEDYIIRPTTLDLNVGTKDHGGSSMSCVQFGNACFKLAAVIDDDKGMTLYTHVFSQFRSLTLRPSQSKTRKDFRGFGNSKGQQLGHKFCGKMEF